MSCTLYAEMAYLRPHLDYLPPVLPPGRANDRLAPTLCSDGCWDSPNHLTPFADPAISATKTSTASGNGKGKGKAGVPHKICYSVAGMPRPMREGASSVGGERRGPREGTVVALTTWKLRDLKVRLLRRIVETSS